RAWALGRVQVFEVNDDPTAEISYARAAEALMEAARVVAAGALTGDPIRHVLEAARSVVPARTLCLSVPTACGAEYKVTTAVGARCAAIGRVRCAAHAR